MRRIHIAHRRCEQGFQGAQYPWHTALVQSLVCYTLIEVYRPPICKKPHANTFAVRTWDLMLPRLSRVLVTNPDRQLPCHFSKTVLRIPSTGELPAVHIILVCGFWQGASYSGAHPVFCFALNLLAHGFRLRFSNIPSDCHSESNRHSPAGIVDEISISTTNPWSMPSLCWVGSLNITSHLAATMAG